MRSRIGLLVAAATVLGVSACTSSGGGKSGGGWFQARPLVMPGQHTTAVRTDPFKSLQVPATERAYNRLSRARREALAKALQGVDCSHLPRLAGSADRVVCDSDRDVLLLGAPLFTADDVTDAKPLAPDGTVAGWQVSLSLTPSAADRMSRWTYAHHAGSQSGVFNDVQTSRKPPCGPNAISDCADFTAYLSNTTVVTVPLSFEPVVKTVYIDGQFSEGFATRLAHKIAG